VNKALPIISVVIASVVVLFIFFNVMPRVDRYLNIRAIETCGGISQFMRDNTAESFKAQYPIEDLYNKCLQKAK